MLHMVAIISWLLPLVICQNESTSYVVDLGYTTYRGSMNDSYPNIVNYYGIKYAAPPIDELRWREPLDTESHGNYNPNTIQDATQRGPICVQGFPYWRQENRTAESEDCLLNILVPKTPASSSIPVLVQIHGGGYDQGDSQSSPGYMMVNQSMGNLIYVSIQYRLAVFGFLGSSEVRENGAANAGLLDQRAALGWVQRNIRAFGGDPAKVTIIGGSAGGGSVMDQLILYGGVSNPPFRAAISEYPWWQSYKNDTILAAQYRQLLESTGCDNLACLRSQITTSLVDAIYYGWGDFYHGPSVDGWAIRDLPSNEFKQGHFAKVPLIVNRDAYEGYNCSPMNISTETNLTREITTIFSYAKQSFFTRFYELYPASDFNSTFFRRAQIYGDYIIDCPTYYMATAMSDWGQPVWKFLFNAGTQLHGAGSPFLWGPTESIKNMTLASILKDWYLGFVLNPNPNSVSNSGTPKPEWPQYDAGPYGFSIMDINYTMIGVTPDFDANSRCDFFHGQSYITRN